MKISQQKEIVNEVLVKIKMNIDEDAIVAGGAPRNWEMGMLANDIDLYMRSFVNNTAARSKSQIENLLGDVEWTTSHDVRNYKFGMDIQIVRILSFMYKGVLFQLIMCDPNQTYGDFKKDIVSHMDIGLNRIWIDWYNKNDGKVCYTREAYRDFQNSTLTLYPKCMTDTQLKHCMENHLPKMQKYFPDYKLVIA